MSIYYGPWKLTFNLCKNLSYKTSCGIEIVIVYTTFFHGGIFLLFTPCPKLSYCLKIYLES